MQLQGRTILIVGGSSGLGLAAAQACSRAGAAVLLTGRDPAKCESAADSLTGPVEWLAIDATAADAAEQAVEATRQAFGDLDGCCHVAGGSGRRHGDGPLHEISDEGWRATLQWNLESVFRTNRAVIRYWKEASRGGSIVNLGSVLADRPAPAYFATHAYASAKAAITGMTTSAAAYYAPDGIRLNVLAPALVETPMSERACGDDAIRVYVEARQPLTGIATPDQFEAAIVFLLSDQSRGVTGQTLRVDGGWSISDGHRPTGQPPRETT